MVPVYEKEEKILEIFKGTEGPYRIENERPWVGGYTVQGQNASFTVYPPKALRSRYDKALRYL